jgi:alpha-N-acetylglucosaminidase
VAAPATPLQLRAAEALVARVVHEAASCFALELIPPADGLDVFELEAYGGTVVLRGSSGVALASALHWYLRHVAGVNVSHPLEPVRLTSPLPAVPRRVRRTTPHRYRYFLNYCTFAYTMAWWDWPEWERMIDWMALRGINLPLAITGQEATWQLVLRDLGFSDEQIARFLPGPAYLPWGWMGNVDGLGGPLPAHWIATHVELERKILQRERELGMTPVLQGFSGHVPEPIRDVIPSAQIHKTGDWSAGFSGTWLLDPFDPLFQRIGSRFIERQRELYGTDHLYAADPFNEVNPHTSDTEFLAGTSRAIHHAMRAADPDAVWVLQSWFLHYRADFWRERERRALLDAVPDDGMLVLDLYGDGHPVWSECDAFHGKPWIWNALHNFGGQVCLGGDLRGIARNLQTALGSPGCGRRVGIGMSMEALGYDPVVPDFVLDMMWRDDVPPVDEWLRDYIARRYGRAEPAAREAWELLLSSVYECSKQTGTFIAERPGFYREGTVYRSWPVVTCDEGKMVRALGLLLDAARTLGASDAYRYDVVNLTRQVVGQLGLPTVNAVEDAYRRRDHAALLQAEQRVIELIRDLDRLVGTRPEFLLGRWIEAARRWGETDAERRLYEWNARNLITMWGTRCTEGQHEDLNLYAHKQWQGMFSNYYLPRWEEFFRRLNRSLDDGTPFDRAAFVADMEEWEQAWSRRIDSFSTEPCGDELVVAREMYDTYFRAEAELRRTA